MGALAARPFRFSVSELSGAVADLGVMLPLVLALVTLNGDWMIALPAAAVLTVALWTRPGVAALLVILLGVVEGVLSHGWPGGRLSIQLPTWAGLPPRAAFGPGFWLLALPQIPLSLAN